MGFKLEATSEKRFNTKMKQLQAFAAKDVNDSLDEAFKHAIRYIKRDAPVDTGRLRRSVYGNINRGKGVIGVRAPYAQVVEFGGRFTRAQPYFYKNIRLGLRRFERHLTRRLKAITNK